MEDGRDTVVSPFAGKVSLYYPSYRCLLACTGIISSIAEVQKFCLAQGLGQPQASVLSVSVKDTLSSLKNHDSSVFERNTGSSRRHKASRKLRKSLSPKISRLKNLFIFNALKPLQRDKAGPKTPPVQVRLSY